MDNDFNRYVNIGNVIGLDKDFIGRFTYDKFDTYPDTYVSYNPIELQEFCLDINGDGYWKSIGYRQPSSLTFTLDNIDTPLKIKLHKHDYYELLIVASDSLEMQVESKLYEFTKWDACLLSNSVRHMEHFKPGVKVYYIALSPGYIQKWPDEEWMNILDSQVFLKLVNKNGKDALYQGVDIITFKRGNTEESSSLQGIIMDIHSELDNKRPGYQLIVRGLLYRLFHVLSDPKKYEAAYTDLGYDGGYSLASSAKKILDRTMHKLTTREIADILNYNGEYINTVFKKHYKISIAEYNKRVCMREAASLLASTSLSILEICKYLRYVNRTHFNNIFLNEYGSTPTQYRESNAVL